MKSSIFISLTLILSIQLASSQDILGTWSNPTTTYDSDLYCCVPTSITIEAMEGTSNMKATYQFPSIFQQGFNAKCGSLFNGAVGNGGTATVYKDASTGQYFIQKYDMSYFSNRNYIFAVSGSALTVKGAGASSATTCSFAMNTQSSGSSGGMIVFLLLVAVIIGLVAFKNHQKKQQSALAQQTLAQNDTTFSNPNPVYVAPQQYVYAQPQAGFVATGQVHQLPMNVNVNPNGNVPVNGGVAISVGANQ